MPDFDAPGWAALNRIKAGAEQPGDMDLADEWMAAVDPKYWVYAAHLARAPKSVKDMFTDARPIEVTTGADKRIKQQFADLAKSGELGMCVHVRHQAPRAARWMSWSPGKLRCVECAELVCREIRGTPEDRRCDACGHIGTRIHKLSTLIPASTYKEVLVPILIFFGLCNHCAGIDPADKERTRSGTQGD